MKLRSTVFLGDRAAILPRHIAWISSRTLRPIHTDNSALGVKICRIPL